MFRFLLPSVADPVQEFSPLSSTPTGQEGILSNRNWVVYAPCDISMLSVVRDGELDGVQGVV